MSTSRELLKRHLVIRTGLPTAEILVMDGLGVVLARGVENLQADLPCGFYKIRYLAGLAPTDEFLELPPGEGDFTHIAPHLNVDVPKAPRPLQSSSKPQGSSAETGELCVALSFESASSLASALAIRAMDGKQVGILPQESMNSSQGWITLELAPGCYLLETQPEGTSAPETIEQCVWVAKGWRTEVLVPVRSSVPDHPGVPDTGNAAVFMSNPEQPELSENEREFNLAELARQTLGRANPDASLGESVIRDMLHGKFENPMLGIYGAYLMLRGRYDRALLVEVAGNLRRMLGNHPDVLALFLVLDDAAGGPLEFRDPPMLRSAWNVIVARSGVVPAGSYARRIGGNLRGWGAWLQWKAPEAEEQPAAAETGKIDFIKLAQAAASRGSSTPPDNLQPLEKILYTYLARSASQSQEAVKLAKSITASVDKKKVLGSVWSPVVRYLAPSDIEKGTLGAAERVFQPENIALSLGIPQDAITDAGASLSKKLGVEFGWRGHLPFKL